MIVTHFRLGQVSELRKKLNAALMHQLFQLRIVVGEEIEMVGSPKILPLKQQGSPRTQQQQGCHRAQTAWTGEPLKALAPASIGDLVVILEIGDKLRRSEIQRRGAPPFLLPSGALALKEEAVLQGRDEFLRPAAKIAEVCFAMAGHGD